jgi:hypothetical protein
MHLQRVCQNQNVKKTDIKKKRDLKKKEDEKFSLSLSRKEEYVCM